MRSRKQNIIVGLDLGSSSFKAVAAGFDIDGNLRLKKALSVESGGVRKGVVTDFEDCTLQVTKLLSQLQRDLKINFKDVYVNINGDSVLLERSRAATSVARADNEISRDDAIRALKSAERINLSENRTIIHSIALEYFVDGIGNILDPVGMNGIRLEVESLIVHCFSPHRKNIYKCVQELGGFRIKELVYSPLLLGLAVLSKNQKEIGTLVLDLGASTTNLIVFEEGKILTMKTIPLGGGNITNDIALALKIPVPLAEKIKIHYGSALGKEISKKEKIDLTEIDESLSGEVSRKYIAQVIEARVEEILDLVNEELKKIEKAGKLPGGVVLVGGGAKLPFIGELAREKLRLSAQIGYATNFSSEVIWSEEERKVLEDPIWVSSVGLILWALNQVEGGVESSPIEEVGGIISKIRNFFSNLIPNL